MKFQDKITSKSNLLLWIKHVVAETVFHSV